MISEIYRKYFQKSLTFLYPLLGFKKGKQPRPYQTYITWEGTQLTPESRKLICVFQREDTESWRLFEMNFLMTHKMLEKCVPIDEHIVVFVFDFNSMAADFDAFLKGKYSHFSTQAKKILTDYYGTHTPEWVYIESFLYPDKYFKQYAQILNTDVDLLREVGELCDVLDMKKETCTLAVPQSTEAIV